MEGAVAVYTVSSQLGFEAIFAGHKPRVFGAPFYAGWGLTQDEFPVQRRQRSLTRAQLFAAAAILYPKWYDPHTDALCSFETALENLAARARAWREDRNGWVASGMRLWKRDTLQKAFGSMVPIDLVGDQRMIYLLDLTAPNGMFKARDFVIRDGDTIYVTEAPLAQWNKTVSAVFGSLIGPLANIDQLAN